jgi:hypothetical protein
MCRIDERGFCALGFKPKVRGDRRLRRRPTPRILGLLLTSLGYWIVRRTKASLRAKRSNPSHRAKKEWIASSQGLLAMTADIGSRSRGAWSPRFAGILTPSRNSEDAGNAGCALHPRSHAQCALRTGFTAYNALSPVSHVLLPPSTPTSGRQDHTPLPYALMPLVSGTISVHRNPSLVGNDGRRPLSGTGWRSYVTNLISVKEKYFDFHKFSA